MKSEKFVKINKNLEKNSISTLKFLNFQNKIEMEFKELNKKIEDLNKKIDEQHLENIRSDEILLQHCRNWAEKDATFSSNRNAYFINE